MNTSSEAIVREFWRLMSTNQFDSVKQILADDFILDWPQSQERIHGPENFARMNSEYPTQGRWSFHINRLIASENSVVTQVSVTDGQQSGEPISFFTIANGKIAHLLEYWPEPFPPAANRSHLTEKLSDIPLSPSS